MQRSNDCLHIKSKKISKDYDIKFWILSIENIRKPTKDTRIPGKVFLMSLLPTSN